MDRNKKKRKVPTTADIFLAFHLMDNQEGMGARRSGRGVEKGEAMKKKTMRDSNQGGGTLRRIAN